MAGQWHRDEIRNATGTFPGGYTAGNHSGAFTTGTAGYATFEGSALRMEIVKFDLNATVPTGPENVPPHVWQPVCMYLGRPAQI